MKKKKKVEFSKSFLIKNFYFWIVVTLFCMMAWLIRGDFPEVVFTGVTTQFGAVCVAYYGKSGYENGVRFNNSDKDGGI